VTVIAGGRKREHASFEWRSGVRVIPDLVDAKSFDPETIELMVASYHSICAELQIVPEEKPLAAETVARLVIELVREGERDRDCLVQYVLHSLRQPRMI
jgi:hypothetical protein